MLIEEVEEHSGHAAFEPRHCCLFVVVVGCNVDRCDFVDDDERIDLRCAVVHYNRRRFDNTPMYAAALHSRDLSLFDKIPLIEYSKEEKIMTCNNCSVIRMLGSSIFANFVDTSCVSFCTRITAARSDRLSAVQRIEYCSYDKTSPIRTDVINNSNLSVAASATNSSLGLI